MIINCFVKLFCFVYPESIVFFLQWSKLFIKMKIDKQVNHGKFKQVHCGEIIIISLVYLFKIMTTVIWSKTVTLN